MCCSALVMSLSSSLCVSPLFLGGLFSTVFWASLDFSTCQKDYSTSKVLTHVCGVSVNGMVRRCISPLVVIVMVSDVMDAGVMCVLYAVCNYIYRNVATGHRLEPSLPSPLNRFLSYQESWRAVGSENIEASRLSRTSHTDLVPAACLTSHGAIMEVDRCVTSSTSTASRALQYRETPVSGGCSLLHIHAPLSLPYSLTNLAQAFPLARRCM